MNDIKLMYIYKLVVVQQLWGLFQNTCNLLSPMEYVLNTVMILDKEDFKRCYI